MFDFFDIGNIGFDDVALAGAALYPDDDDLSPYSDLDLDGLNRSEYDGLTMSKKTRPNSRARRSLKNVGPMYREVQNVALNPADASTNRNIFADGLNGLGTLNQK